MPSSDVPTAQSARGGFLRSRVHDPVVTWNDPPPIDPPPEVKPQTDYFLGFVKAMYDNARWQIRMQQYAAGVLVAQVAVEMGARNAFTSLLVRR
jgi:hypothetical protein